ncbi:hypothetical protein BO78DRAFT_38610 [Aspergillus sclerotiicarbonarius CBS 121057]|uniref:Uncharacterized protein n=1 Tax=Aspergillus sclerotiicarbonarius (strain CBS 121057 / IBT 28362) TaxID=1448318 RepID=A0A319ER69_ASPSB|nr:hypothetical protein BO78DRAFT_38610 [Aspergillus sclerotiicarbonarius CBS 121057]
MSFLPLVDHTFENPPFDPSTKFAAEEKRLDKGKGIQEPANLDDPVASLKTKLELTDMAPGQEGPDVPPCSLSSNNEPLDTPVPNRDSIQDDVSRAETMSVDYLTAREGDDDAPILVLDDEVPDTAVQGPSPSDDGISHQVVDAVGETAVAPIHGDVLTTCNEPSPEAPVLAALSQDASEDGHPHEKPEAVVAADMSPSQEDQDINKSNIRPSEDVTSIIGRIEALVTNSIDSLPKTPAQDNISSMDTVSEVPNSPTDESNHNPPERLVLTYSKPTEARVRVRGCASVGVQTMPKTLTRVKRAIPNAGPVTATNETETATIEPTRRTRLGYSEDSETTVEYTGYATQVEIIWRY